MKLLLIGDLHLRIRTPAKRTEKDFMREVCLDKLRQVVEIYSAQSCSAALQVGDFFDGPNPSGELLAHVIEDLLSAYDTHGFDLYAIHGQHDQLYHTKASMDRSALRVMEAAGAVSSLLGRGRARLMDTPCRAYGASFGQEPPLPLDPDKFNILVAHAMVGDKPLFPGHEITGPHEYARKHPGYNLYVLGDYHYPFGVSGDGYDVINPGCLIRKTVADKDHRPKVVVYDTDNPGGAEDVFLDVADPSECFDLTKDAGPEDSPVIAELAERLARTGGIGVGFTQTLQDFFDDQNTPKEIREKIWASLEPEPV